MDDPTAERPFSLRLREANEWDEEFTKLAIDEYRRFMYLRMVTDKPVTPSVVVDSVWHMHLHYLRNYIAFCKELAGRIIFHDPGKGGEVEATRFKLQYFDTLMAYLDHFGTPPKEIWGTIPTRLDTGSADI